MSNGAQRKGLVGWRGARCVRLRRKGTSNMPASIKTSDVRQALRPTLGTELVDGAPVAEQVAQALRAYAPYRDTFFTLQERLANTLFNLLYSLLGPSMTVRLDDGSSARIRISDLTDIADDAMYALFNSLTVYSVNYENLKDYSLRAGSLSAMRVLYEKYDAFQSPEEKRLMARIIRGGYPQRRYTAWLPEAQ